MLVRLGFFAALPLLAVAGCAAPRPDYDPGVSAADFVAGIDNPFLPLTPGSSWRYEADRGDVVVEVRVLNETRLVNGVAATVVRDTESEDGRVVEDTWDWFAQDQSGNVWYLGEDTCEYEGGVCVDTGGAWEWGVDGALPGVVMWADPAADGAAYFQEFYWGEAVDEAEVIALGRSVSVPAGTFTDTVTTHEWTRLERGSDEVAVYARGVGLVGKWGGTSEPGGDGEVLVAYQVA